MHTVAQTLLSAPLSALPRSVFHLCVSLKPNRNLDVRLNPKYQLNVTLKQALVIVACAWYGPTTGASSADDKAALVALYSATNGTGWSDNSGWDVMSSTSEPCGMCFNVSWPCYVCTITHPVAGRAGWAWCAAVAVEA